MGFFDWAFPKKILSSKVLTKGRLTWFSLFGTLFYIGVLITYILQYMLAMSDDLAMGDTFANKSMMKTRMTYMSLGVLVGHVVVGILVAYDAYLYSGSNVLLQIFVMGTGTSITFLQAAILSLTVFFSNDFLFAYALSALLLACFANSMMLSVLFAMFHTGVTRSSSFVSKSKIGTLAF